MKLKNSSLILITLFFSSCSSVQEYVFPSLSDEEVVTPPSIEETEIVNQEPNFGGPTAQIPPSQYAPPPQYIQTDTGPTGTFVGGKINQFRSDLASIQTAISAHNNDYLRFKDLVD